MVNKPLIRPAISGGGTLGGGTLTSHDMENGTSSEKRGWGVVGLPFFQCWKLNMFEMLFVYEIDSHR